MQVRRVTLHSRGDPDGSRSSATPPDLPTIPRTTFHEGRGRTANCRLESQSKPSPGSYLPVALVAPACCLLPGKDAVVCAPCWGAFLHPQIEGRKVMKQVRRKLKNTGDQLVPWNAEGQPSRGVSDVVGVGEEERRNTKENLTCMEKGEKGFFGFRFQPQRGGRGRRVN